METINHTEFFYRKISLWLAGLVLLVSLSVMAGWLLDLTVLKSISPKWVSMKWNTALGFFLAANCIFLMNLKNQTSSVKAGLYLGASLVLVSGALHLTEYIAQANLGIDEWFVRDNTAAVGTSHPGRMAPLTAILFVVTGFSFIIKTAFNRAAWFQGAQAIIAFASMFALTGYLLGVKQLSGFEEYTTMAFQSSLCFLLLSLAALCTDARRGFMYVITQAHSGGRLFRNSFPLITACVVLLGWLLLKAQAAGWFGTPVGVALFALSVIFLLATILYHNALSLSRAEKSLSKEKSFSDSAIDALPGIFYVFDEGGRFLRWNKNFELVTGCNQEEIRQMHPLDFLSEPDKETAADHIKTGFLTGEATMEATVVSKQGKSTPFFFLGKKIKINGTTALIGTGIDITERRNAESNTKEKIEELESFNLLAIGRELKMMELKKEVNQLSQTLGQHPPYDTDFVDSRPPETGSTTKST